MTILACQNTILELCAIFQHLFLFLLVRISITRRLCLLTCLPTCLPARQGWMELLGASASISGVSLVVVQLWSDLKALSPAGNSILSPPLVTV